MNTTPSPKGAPNEPEALVARLRLYQRELAAEGAGIHQSHALGCSIAADTIEQQAAENGELVELACTILNEFGGWDAAKNAAALGETLNPAYQALDDLARLVEKIRAPRVPGAEGS